MMSGLWDVVFVFVLDCSDGSEDNALSWLLTSLFVNDANDAGGRARWF